MKRKIFVTGGHYTPAKAVIDVLLKDGKYDIYYIGRKFSLEGDRAISLEFQELQNRQDVSFLEITTGRPQRKFTSKSLLILLKIPVGFVQSLFWILRYRPSVIASFGGYVAIPVASVAWLFRIPIAHHEQVPAFDYPSKFLCRIATKVMVSFRHLLPKGKSEKWLYTGNPIRNDIFTANLNSELTSFKKNKDKLKLPTVYLTGGNQGSHLINETFLAILPRLLEICMVIWQTGDSTQFQDFSKITSFLNNQSEPTKNKVLLRKFISASDIGAVFSLSDFVIGRSGANTVFELAALGKPAILIPIPWVHDAEQQKNAEALAAFGGAVILPQNNLTPERFLTEIETMISKLELYKKSAQKATELNPKDSDKKIALQIEKLLD